MIFAIPLLFLWAACTSNKDKESQKNLQDTIEIPNWQAGQLINQFEKVIPGDLQNNTLSLKILANEQSLTEGSFTLLMDWLYMEHEREIDFPVYPNQFYPEITIQEKEGEKNVFELAYYSPKGEYQAIYEVSIVNKDLKFEQVKTFILIQNK